MTAFFIIIALVPLIIALFAKFFLKGVSWKELLIIVVAELIVAGISALTISCSNTLDQELLNGVVVDKKSERVSCSHSYSCHCRQECSGTGKNRSCRTVCDTCYEHSYDINWNVYTSINTSIRIDRIDRRGVSQPPRYTSVIIGEPISTTHFYENYIKASPDTLFRHQGLHEKYAATLPKYPIDIYDYYRINRLITVDVPIDNPQLWNDDISKLNAELGNAKQVNIVVVIAKNKPRDWFSALEEYWIGGKKNDAILVVSVDDQMKPQWAEIMAWTSNQLFKIKLRDDIVDEPIIDRKAIMTALQINVSQYYVRKPMHDFEYLKSQIVPTSTEWIITLIIGLIIAAGLLWTFQIIDIDEYLNSSAHSRSRRY